MKSALFAILLPAFLGVSLSHAEPAWSLLPSTVPGGAAILPPRFTPTRPGDAARHAVPDRTADLPRPAADPARPQRSGESAVVSEVTQEPRNETRRSDAAPEHDEDATSPGWVTPLMDRVLRTSEQTRDLAPDLREAMSRIDGLYTTVLKLDPNDITLAWSDHSTVRTFKPLRTTASYMEGLGPCEVFTRPRQRHARTLTLLSPADCYGLMRSEPRRLRGLTATVMTSSNDSAPLFAAPLPGARLSSQEFWTEQKARIKSIEAQLHGGWHERDDVFTAGTLQVPQ